MIYSVDTTTFEKESEYEIIDQATRSIAKRLRAVTPDDVKQIAKKYLAGPPVVTVTTPEAVEVEKE